LSENNKFPEIPTPHPQFLATPLHTLVYGLWPTSGLSRPLASHPSIHLMDLGPSQIIEPTANSTLIP